MSVRYLYKSIPHSKRVCSYYRCQKPILRNIDRDKDGHLYHHGCLMSAQDERYRCLECLNVFDATEVAFDIKQVVKGDSIVERMQIMCPHCGSVKLKPSHTRGD
jgi:DNA-directed RNA polymerase subunit RPC12/RpoP